MSPMPSVQTKFAPLMTVADFLDWSGDGSGRKFQLVDGFPRAMAPASATHTRIQARLASIIDQHLVAKDSPCYVGTEPAIGPRIRSDINLRVPDLGVACAPNEPGQRFFPDPILLIEILSPGNQSDTWDNVWAYTTLPSVQEILVVHSTSVHAYLLRRDAEGAWPSKPEEIAGADALLTLRSIAMTCPFGEAYANTYLAR